MKALRILFLFSVPLLFTVSCKKENRCDCIKRTGDIIKEVRHINGFDKVFVENNVNVFITQDSIFEITVEAGENIAPLITTKVEDGTLFVRNKNRCSWTRSYQKPLNVYIKMPVIKYITSDGTGDVRSLNTIVTDAFDVMIKNSGNIELTVNNKQVVTHMHGSGDVTLHGYAQEHLCSIGGTAYMYAEDLQTDYTFIHTYTLGKSTVRASNLLICIIDEKGDVYCYGNPSSVQKSASGSGQLYLR